MEFLWRRLLFSLPEFLNWALLWLLNFFPGLKSSLLHLKLMFALRGSLSGKLTLRGACRKAFVRSCCWKTLNSNSLDRFCAFTESVICSWKSLPNNPFPEFSYCSLWSFIIDFAWQELFMAPASALSRIWYDMVLLVCPATSTVCWTKFSKSSMVKSASLSGAVV